MSEDQWLKIAARIVAGRPISIDEILFENPGERKNPGTCIDLELPAKWTAPSPENWPLLLPECATIGVRVTEKLDAEVQIATRLIAMATERSIVPVIFSTIAPSGFERFGFRVERLAGSDAAQLSICEEELKSFWDVAIVVNANDILNMR